MLLEREQELGELSAALGEVGAGKGCAIGIEASAGLGKTRLLQEAREVATSAGLNVLSARATELEREFPFALVRQLFEPQLAGLSAEERDELFEGAMAGKAALGLDPNGESHDSFAVLHGLYWVTAALAERRPLLLAVDDAHTADAASLDFLGFLLPRLEELPVLLAIANRPDEPDPSEGLRRVLADPAMRHLSPRPLSLEATATLLDEGLARQPDPAFAAACHEVSGGNPFLLSELARTLAEREIEPVGDQTELVQGLVPQRVAHMVLARLGRLSAGAGTVARALAVLGEDSDLRLLAALAGIDAGEARAAADQLRASSILSPAAPLRFIHPLVRSAIYADVPVGERGGMHARAAALLRAGGAAPEQIATQLMAGESEGDREAVETLIEAGERALANGAPRSAIAYLRRALDEPPPEDLRATVLEPIMVAAIRVADYAVFAAVESELFAEMERQPSLRTRWAIRVSVAMALAGRFEDAARLLRDVAEVAEREGDAERAFLLYAQLNVFASIVPSVSHGDLGRFDGQIDPDGPGGRLEAAIEARATVAEGNARDAAAAAKRALGNGGAIFAEEAEVVAAVTSVMTLVAADETAAARRATTRAVEIARKRGETAGLLRAWLLSGLVGWAEGDLVTAEPDLRQSIELARLAGSHTMVLLVLGVFVEVLIERDELEAAEREIEAVGVATGPIPASPIFTLVIFARGHLRLARGEFELATEDFAALSYREDVMDFGGLSASFAGPPAARALAAIGDDRRGCELSASMAPLASRWGSPSTVAHVLRVRAAAQNGGEAIATLEEAADVLEDSPRRLERAHALLDLGEALRRAGRRTEAREPLREALKLARQGGAARVAKRAHEELQATGEKVRRYAPIGIEALTPSERRVAELAASGMTNRQIAQSLFVTVKTVEAHLSAAYDKLDIDSRKQLPEALGERTPPS